MKREFRSEKLKDYADAARTRPHLLPGMMGSWVLDIEQARTMEATRDGIQTAHAAGSIAEAACDAVMAADPAAASPPAGRPKRERKQVERIRSSQLRTATKRSPANGQATAGRAKDKSRASVSGKGVEDVEEVDDHDDEGELDIPLTARALKLDAADQSRKKTSPSAVVSQKAVKKRRVSEEQGPDVDSEEASLIRYALMVLCDDLGEEVLAGITLKVLRRKLEKRMDRDEGDFDEWKTVITDWYDQAERIKAALRKWLQEFDGTEAAPKAIRRELERDLKLEEGKLDSWKAEIDRWTLKLSEEVDQFSPLRSPKGKPSNSTAVGRESKDVGVPHENSRQTVFKGSGQAQYTDGLDIDAVMQRVESKKGEVDVKKRVSDPVGSGEKRQEKRRAAEAGKEKFLPPTDEDSGGKEARAKRQERNPRKGEDATVAETDQNNAVGSRGESRAEQSKVQSQNRESSEKQDARYRCHDGKKQVQTGQEAGRTSIDHKGKAKDRDKRHECQREQQKDGSEKISKGSPGHQIDVGDQAEPSARRSDAEDRMSSASVGPKGEKGLTLGRLPSASSKLLERRASLLGKCAGKEPASLLEVKPVSVDIQRAASEANEFRACPLRDLDELQKMMESEELKEAARKRQEEEDAVHRAKAEREADERKKRDERAQEKIREAAKRPLPSFKDLKKSKAALPANISTSDDSAGLTKEGGVLKKAPTAAAGKGGAEKTVSHQRNVGFATKVEHRLIEEPGEDEQSTILTPNTKSLQQYANAQHVGDILLQWGIISQDQVDQVWRLCGGVPERFGELARARFKDQGVTKDLVERAEQRLVQATKRAARQDRA